MAENHLESCPLSHLALLLLLLLLHSGCYYLPLEPLILMIYHLLDKRNNLSLLG